MIRDSQRSEIELRHRGQMRSGLQRCRPMGDAAPRANSPISRSVRPIDAVMPGDAGERWAMGPGPVDRGIVKS
jgi:hypothetical protein